MTIGELWRRLVHFVRGSAAADDLREEMQLHVELRAAALRDVGAAPAQANASAARRFGNAPALRDAAREVWGLMWAEHAARDARFAFRRCSG